MGLRLSSFDPLNQDGQFGAALVIEVIVPAHISGFARLTVAVKLSRAWLMCLLCNGNMKTGPGVIRVQSSVQVYMEAIGC